MVNTINALDSGVFCHIKKLIKLYQGLAKKRKVNRLSFCDNIMIINHSIAEFRRGSLCL